MPRQPKAEPPSVGVKSSDINTAPPPPPPGPAPFPDPPDRKEGDVVVEYYGTKSLHALPTTHNIWIVNRTDASQMYPWLMTCSCGGQAVAFNLNAVKKAALNHLHARLVETPDGF